MVRKLFYILFFLATNLKAWPQSFSLHVDNQPILIADDTNGPASRKWIVAGGAGLIMAGSLGLYMGSNDYHFKKEFHVVHSGNDWLQLDKNLHGYLSYTAANLLNGSLEWAGLPQKKAAWLSAGSSLAYFTVKEFIDGHDPKYGWSWGDMGANLAGIAVFATQQLTWGEQRLQLKMSALPKRYGDPELEQAATSLFGSRYPKRLLKDYNQQTFWLSANLKSLTRLEALPAWLSLSVGTGGNNMFGRKENYQTDNDGTVIFDRRDLQRYRQWYLAPDIDLTKIPTRSKVLKTVLFALNSFKFPLPALEFANGKIKAHAIMW
jgi:hypothetical protein